MELFQGIPAARYELKQPIEKYYFSAKLSPMLKLSLSFW
jgi:hypothetical protein